MKAILEFDIETNEGRQRFIDSLNGPKLRAEMRGAVEDIGAEMQRRTTPEEKGSLQSAILIIMNRAENANVDLYA